MLDQITMQSQVRISMRNEVISRDVQVIGNAFNMAQPRLDGQTVENGMIVEGIKYRMMVNDAERQVSVFPCFR